MERNMNNQMELLVNTIKQIMETTKNSIVREVNLAMLNAYWQIGHLIVEHEQYGEIKAQYGSKLLVELSKQLSNELGRGYSRSNLYNMREF